MSGSEPGAHGSEVHQSRQFLTMAQLIHLTGLSRRKLEMEVAAGRLVPHRFGRALRFAVSEYDRWARTFRDRTRGR